MAPKPFFIDSPTCRDRRHCRTCRDLVGGRYLRRAWRKVYEMPNDDAVDFDCPQGEADDDRPPVAVALVVERSAVCDACAGRGECYLHQIKPCLRRTYLARPGIHCPAAKF